MKTNTKLIHTKGSPDFSTGSVVPPLHLSTIFAMENPSSNDGFQYGRVGNPTRLILENTLEELEGGKFCSVFASGSAAISTLFMTLKKGDHILCHCETYEGTIRLLKTVLANLGIDSDFVDMKDTDSLEKSFTSSTKMVLLESPTNPSLTILDIKTIINIAHKRSILVATDNTFATPILQKPLNLGCDVVIESLTKAINGHSDAMGGALITNNKELSDKIKFLQHTVGSILSPFECFMILRGLKTLPIRILHQQKNAIAVADFLNHHSKIQHVFFPGFEKNNFLKKQMKGPGFMISFIIKGDKKKSELFVKALKLITIAHSLGGPETLIQQPTKMMDLTLTKKHATDFTLSDTFFRLSVGLENAGDIISNLNRALNTI